jgi:hypothetical protein
LRPARAETFERTITGLLKKRADLFNEAERIRDRLAEIRNDLGAIDRTLGVLGYTGHRRCGMPERTDWEAKARGILRAEMVKQNMTYSQLLERLESIGVTEDERNLRNKVSRGKFTAAFLLQCLAALGSRQLYLD